MPSFNLDFSSPHRPAHSSPLSSSPIRATSPPLSPTRNSRAFPIFDTQSSPIKAPPKFNFASRGAKPNPLRQTRENAQESRRNLFLRNVRKRADDKKWERRGGDQEALKLEWMVLNKQRRDQKNADIDGIVFEDEIEDFRELQQQEATQNPDDMMVDVIAQEEEELNAMLSMFESQSSQPLPRPSSPALTDDEDYDDIFMDILSQQGSGSQDIVLSGQMDIS
ncbi:hypothetical protein M426DRAFT_324774 [Hypoxylon sp. CI-4A]|nr:hypothetical protein M426DRAFT_324774 [Hypoxylon sp. CI-4A]